MLFLEILQTVATCVTTFCAILIAARLWSDAVAPDLYRTRIKRRLAFYVTVKGE